MYLDGESAEFQVGIGRRIKITFFDDENVIDENYIKEDGGRLAEFLRGCTLVGFDFFIGCKNRIQDL